MYGSPQGALHKKVQLHIKNCSNYKLKNVAANQKMFLQIKKCCFKVHFQPCVKTCSGCHVLFLLWEGSQQRIKVLLSLWLSPTAVEY